LAEKENFKIKEIPVKWSEPRSGKESKVNVFKVSWRYFREALRLKRQNNPNRLSRNEIKFVWLISVILMIVTTLPYLFGYLTREGLYYTGAHIFSPIDTSVYYSYIEQVKDGHFLFSDLFTNGLNNPKLLNIFWLIVGLMARVTTLSAPITYQLARLLLIPLFMFVLYKFISFFIGDYSVARKKLCFLYSIFASGLGSFLYFWLHAGMNNVNLSMDVWVPEASNFLIIFTTPHFIASITLIISIFYLFWLSVENKKYRFSVSAGILALLLFNFHPFFVPTIYFVTLAYVIFLFIKNKKIDARSIWNYLFLVIISAPSVFYYFFLLLNNESLRIKAAQNICLTPGGLNFFISYGLGLLFAIFAMIYLVENKKINNKFLFLTVWFWASILLIYGPFNFQRRLTEGFQIPLTILAFVGLVIIFDLLKIRWKFFRKIRLWQSLPIFIILLCFTNALVYFGDFSFLESKTQIVYLAKSTKEAVDWYRNNSNSNDTILASVINGNLIPGLIGRRVFLGHGIETIDFKVKIAELQDFFQDKKSEAAEKDFLIKNRINYLFYSDLERQLGSINPDAKYFLRKIYNKDGVEIFKVIED
jgi:hypothetical protein